MKYSMSKNVMHSDFLFLWQALKFSYETREEYYFSFYIRGTSYSLLFKQQICLADSQS